MAARPPLLAFIALLLLAAGFALGYIAASTTPVPHPPAPSPPAAAGVDAPPPPPPTPPTLRQALAALPAPVVPTGDGTIEALVRLPDGSPLSGVTVTLQIEPRTDDFWTGPTPFTRAEDTEQRVLYQVLSTRWRDAARTTAVTGNDGLCRFEACPDRDHRPWAELPGYLIQYAGSQYSIRPGRTAEFTAIPASLLRLVILRPDGTPPAVATLRWEYGTGRSTASWRVEKPEVPLPPGSGTLTVLADGFASDPQPLVIPAARTSTALTVRLRPKLALRGRVLFPEGEATKGPAFLNLELLPEGAAAPLPASPPGGHAIQASPERFAFAFENLAPGRYRLSLRRTRRGPVVAAEEVVLADAPLDRDLRAPPLERVRYAVVRALGPAGETLRDLSVGVGFSWSTGAVGLGGTAGAATVPREDGSLWVLLEDLPEAPDGKVAAYTLEVRSELHGARRVDLPGGPAPEVVVRFEAPGTVLLTLEGLAESRFLGKVRVWLSPTPWSKERTTVFAPGFAGPDAEGRIRFPAVPPGTYEAVLTLQVGQSETAVVGKFPLAVAAGPNEAVLPFPALHAVVVKGASEWVSVARVGEGGWSFSSAVGPDGRATLDGLPEGEYRFQSGERRKTAGVPGTAEVDLGTPP